jgi:hypothetical protein
MAMRIVWRTRAEAQTAVAMMKARMAIMGTAVADALNEAQRDIPDCRRIVELLSKARAAHTKPLQMETL